MVGEIKTKFDFINFKFQFVEVSQRIELEFGDGGRMQSDACVDTVAFLGRSNFSITILLRWMHS